MDLALVEIGEVLILKQVLVQDSLELAALWEALETWVQAEWVQEEWGLEEWDLEDNLRIDLWDKECQTKEIQWACNPARDLQLETLILMQHQASSEMQEIL